MKLFTSRLAFPLLYLAVGLLVFGVSYTMLGQGSGSEPGESDTPGPGGNTSGSNPPTTGAPGGGGQPPTSPPEELAPENDEPGPVGVVNELAKAIYADDVDALESLLSQGEDSNQVDEFGNTPLYWVVTSSDLTSNTIGLMNTLVRHGAFVDHANHVGLTPLHYVVAFGGDESEGLAKALIDAGANPHIITTHPPTGEVLSSPYVEALEDGNNAAAAMRQYPGHVEPDNKEELEREGMISQMIEDMVNTPDQATRERLADEIIRLTFEGDDITEEQRANFRAQMLDFESPHEETSDDAEDDENCETCEP